MDVLFPTLRVHAYFPRGKDVVAVENPTAEENAKEQYDELRMAIKNMVRW